MVLAEILEEKIVINENGVPKTVSKLEAAVKQLVSKAAFGDLIALQQLTALARSAQERAIELPTKPLSDVDLKIMQRVPQRQAEEWKENQVRITREEFHAFLRRDLVAFAEKAASRRAQHQTVCASPSISRLNSGRESVDPLTPWSTYSSASFQPRASANCQDRASADSRLGGDWLY
jgi:Family of unknown function (DUF5681)